jgi:hypothetical protein
MLINCRQATRLISQSMDTTLPWHRRLAIRVHLLYCVWCRRYATQLHIVSKAARQLETEVPRAADAKLSLEAKDQIRARLHSGLGSAPPGDSKEGPLPPQWS